MRWAWRLPRMSAPKGREPSSCVQQAPVIASYRGRPLSAHTTQNAFKSRDVERAGETARRNVKASGERFINYATEIGPVPPTKQAAASA